MDVGSIQIQLNGEVREVPAGLTLAALLEWLKLPGDRVAVERNLEIVARDRWRSTSVEAGDRFEVVHFVGGGAPLTSRGLIGGSVAERRGARLRSVTLAWGDVNCRLRFCVSMENAATRI